MNTLKQLLVITALLVGTVSVATAGPGPQYWETQHKEAQLRELKQGDKVTYVCNQCKTISEKTMASSDEAMDHCKEGAMITCPMCKKQAKVAVRNQGNASPGNSEVTYVNEKGEECMFVAKISNKK